MALDRVLVIPAANPPHKTYAAAPYEHRYRMVELACQGEEGFEPSRLEEGEGRSYSMRTVEKIRNYWPADVLFFLIGSDAFAEIRTWHRWEELLAAVEFIVFERPSSSFVIPPGARVHTLRSVQMDVSSSSIRSALARGEAPVDLSPRIVQYIFQNGLYR